jgi:GxxExxY protein
MDKSENELAHVVIGLAIEVHRILGPGFHKEIYTDCLKQEFKNNQIPAVFKQAVPLIYKEVAIEVPHVIDCVVDSRLFLQIETTDQIHDGLVNAALKILRQEQYKLGLIINFHAPLLKNGIRRINNRMNNESS